MVKTIEKTGKSVEDAIQAAILELGVKASDVDVEVLETPSKGIFGIFGTKPARIKVSLKEVAAQEDSSTGVKKKVGETPTTVNFKFVHSVDTLPTIDDEVEETTTKVDDTTDAAPSTKDVKPAVKAKPSTKAKSSTKVKSSTKAEPAKETEVVSVKTEISTEEKIVTPEVKTEIKVETENPVDAEPKVETENKSETVDNIDAEPFDREKVIEAAKKFLSDVFAAMKIEESFTVKESDSDVIFDLPESVSTVFIGRKHGRTLDALQYLTNLAANRSSKEKVRFILDVADYRERREEMVKKMARSVADRVIRMRQDIKMDSMSRHERRIVHTTLQDNKRVETHSVGEEPHRYVVVSLKKK